MTPDFKATLKYNTHEEGGRSMPALSGYRPDIKFDFDEMITCGIQTFLNKEKVYPGDIVEAVINIFSVPHFKGRLNKGMGFTFCEGPNIIGTGIIDEILNQELRTID
ncbi:hypothetical protein [Flavobacterium sp. NRK1]|uniref:hypothetical protein n=1 Tax=Flavobacterium sp. NRK1 TaxID=2954929 RepID=UPI0020939CA9|nr:hypothetical protein [Flavobacterium sp. NRK1]MCO6148852.1 hypothetical protein [Flavobacterium sp. NRK1]